MVPDIYEKKIRIRSEHVTCSRRLRTSSLFRFLQEASIAHTEQLGMGRGKTLDRGLLWILSRQEVDIREMPEYDDEIVIKSWPGDMLHVFFPRFYEVWRGDDLLIEGDALWLLIDEAERRMIFPSEYGIEIPGLPGGPAPRTGSAIRAPEDSELFFTSSYTARFSQIDINGHVNNANYFDILDDLLPSELTAGSFPSSVRAEYLTEIRPGETLLVRGFRSPDGTVYTGGIADMPDAPSTPAARPLFRLRETFHSFESPASSAKQ